MNDSTIGTEYLPNASIEKVNLQIISSEGETDGTVIVDVCVYDHFNKTWSANERFTRYFNISCFISFGNESHFVDKITNGEVSLESIPEGSGFHTKRITEQFDSLEEFVVSKRGKKYRKFKKRFQFYLGSEARKYLSCYAVSMINVEDLRNNENLDLSYAEKLNYMGSIESERITENGEMVIKSILFKDTETSEPWGGPVHSHENTVMAGSQHRDLPHGKLQREEVENVKFNLFIDLEMPTGESRYTPLENSSVGAPPTLSFLTQQIYSGFSAASLNPQYSIIPMGMGTNENHSIYFQMEPFEDIDRNLKNIVVVDLLGLLLEESRLGQLVNEAEEESSHSGAMYENPYNYDFNNTGNDEEEEAEEESSFSGGMLNNPFNSIDITNITVKRSRVKQESFLDAFGRRNSLTRNNTTTTIAKSNNNHAKVKTKTLYQTSANRKFSIDPTKVQDINANQVFDGKRIPRSLLKTARKIGKVEQLNTSLPNNFRTISFVDYDINSSIEGEYKYSIELSLRDVYYDFCHNFFKQLNRHLHKLDGFYNSLILKNVYTDDGFRPDFLVEFYSQYGIEINLDGMVVGDFFTDSLKESFLVKSIQDLFRAESLIMRRRSLHHKNSLNLFSTDMDKISSLITHYKKVINLFKIRYDISDSQNYEKSSSKSRKDRGYIQKTITLSKTYERKRSVPIGVNFISMFSPNDEIPRVNTLQFKNRADTEFNKFFNTSVVSTDQAVKNISPEMRSQFANLHEAKYKMFTPSRLYFANQEIDMTQINPKSFDADLFNSIRVSQAVLRSTETNTDHDDLKDTSSENLDQYTDSRDFLGGETKFNETVLRLLKFEPIKISSTRKKFRFFDNKILASKNSNFSLKTFDLSNETSPIANILKNNLETVPIQVKALSLLKSPLTNFDLSSIDFDPLSNPQTQEVFSQNYLNIGKVEILEGFPKVNGRYMMKRPRFKEIEFNNIDKYQNKNSICRIVDTNFQGLGADRTGMMVYDRAFLLENSNEDTPESPIDENTQVMQMSNQVSNEEETVNEEIQSSTEGDFTSDFDAGSNLTDSSGQPVYRSDISNTVVVQNELNSAVISVIPLLEEQAASQVSSTIVDAPVTPIQATSPTPTGGPGY